MFASVSRYCAVFIGVFSCVFMGSAQAELDLNFGLGSEYLREGVSQTEGKLAYNTGLTWQHNSGFYLGGWAANLEHKTDDLNYEADLFTGFYWPLSKDIAFDLYATRYSFYGDSNAWYQDYNELGASLLLGNHFTLGWRGSNDYMGKDRSWQALNVSYVQPVSDFNLEFYLGNQHWLNKDTDAGAAYSDSGKSHYWHFRVGLERTWNNWDYRLTFERAIVGGRFDAGSNFQFGVSRHFKLLP